MQFNQVKTPFMSKNRKLTPLSPKAKYIRTLKVKLFNRTKLRVRQATMFFPVSTVINILKNTKNHNKHAFNNLELIDINKYKAFNIIISKRTVNKFEKTSNLLINKWLSLYSAYQPSVITDNSKNVVFLINPLSKLVEVINTKNIYKLNFNLVFNQHTHEYPVCPIITTMDKSQNPNLNSAFTIFKKRAVNNLLHFYKTYTPFLANFQKIKKLTSAFNMARIILKPKNSILYYKLKKMNNRFYNRKAVKKISKKWFSYESEKLKRFGSKYHGPNLRRKLPVFGIYKAKKTVISKYIYNMFKEQLVEASSVAVASIKRHNRLQALVAQFPVNDRWRPKFKWNIKKSYDYKPFRKIILKNKIVNKTKILKILSSKHLILGFSNFRLLHKKKLNKLLVLDTKVFNKHLFSKKHDVPQANSWKTTNKQTKLKISLIHQALFKNPKNSKLLKFSKVNKLSINTLNKVSKQITYKIKWFNYFELKSFRWKFYSKRWYFTMSRWKRLVEFRRMLRNAWRNYRKLKKNFLFIKLLRANFKYILGIKESELLYTWAKIRRGTNLDSNISSVDYLNQALQLKMDGLTMFLGLAPNRIMAQEFVHFGGLRVNGLVVTNINYSVSQNDMVQIDSKVNQEIKALYKPAHWDLVRARLKFTKFLQIQWSIMLFMMVRYPHNYELFNESILNQRWVRFFIRYFPVRIAKYQKAKIKWYKY